VTHDEILDSSSQLTSPGERLSSTILEVTITLLLSQRAYPWRKTSKGVGAAMNTSSKLYGSG